MNPFAAPQRVFVSASPCDMRAGILTLAERVSSQLGRDPSDGSLYCFVSRDRRKCKMVRFDDGAWCMWYVRPCEGTFRWSFGGGGPSVEVERRQLLWLLEGLPVDQPCAHRVLPGGAVL